MTNAANLAPNRDFISGLVGALMQKKRGFLADEIFPSQADNVPATGALQRLAVSAFGGSAQTHGYSAESGGYNRIPTAEFEPLNYQVKDRAYSVNVHYNRKRDLDAKGLGSLLEIETLRVLAQMDIDREVECAGLLQADNSGSGGYSAAAALAWDQAGSDPIADIEGAASAMDLASAGLRPNFIVLTKQQMSALRRNAMFRSYTASDKDRAVITDGIIRAAVGELGLELFVGNAVRNTAQLNLAVSMSTIWAAGTAVVGYRDTSAIEFSNGAGFGLATCFVRLTAEARDVKEWREEGSRQDVVGVIEREVLSPYYLQCIGRITGCV